MPTKRKIISIVLDDETARHFDDFRFNNRISTESKAGLMLIRAGMDALSDEYPELDMETKLETGKKAQDDVLNEERVHLRAQR